MREHEARADAAAPGASAHAGAPSMLSGWPGADFRQGGGGEPALPSGWQRSSLHQQVFSVLAGRLASVPPERACTSRHGRAKIRDFLIASQSVPILNMPRLIIKLRFQAELYLSN